MTSIAYFPVTIQVSPQLVPSTQRWFREVTIIAHYLARWGVLSAIEEQVRFARSRFGSCIQPELAIVVPVPFVKVARDTVHPHAKPRRVSAILRPRPEPARKAEATAPTTGTAPLLWRDWSRCQTRREWMGLLRSHRGSFLAQSGRIVASAGLNA